MDRADCAHRYQASTGQYYSEFSTRICLLSGTLTCLILNGRCRPPLFLPRTQRDLVYSSFSSPGVELRPNDRAGQMSTRLCCSRLICHDSLPSVCPVNTRVPLLRILKLLPFRLAIYLYHRTMMFLAQVFFRFSYRRLACIDFCAPLAS